ncbi:MAG: hypothetical protein QOI31_1742 [Solirubrobacterales bacterium]|jgi:hypothetical protein|nr:hypothetical protein [Solirubrobacterales bacterium]
MHVRIALTEAPKKTEDHSDAFVIAWPLDNDPGHATTGAAAAIHEEVGGLPVLVVALDSRGDLWTYGEQRHVFTLQELGLDSHSWVNFEIELPRLPLFGLPTPAAPRPPIAA